MVGLARRIESKILLSPIPNRYKGGSQVLRTSHQLPYKPSSHLNEKYVRHHRVVVLSSVDKNFFNARMNKCFRYNSRLNELRPCSNHCEYTHTNGSFLEVICCGNNGSTTFEPVKYTLPERIIPKRLRAWVRMVSDPYVAASTTWSKFSINHWKELDKGYKNAYSKPFMSNLSPHV